MKEELLELYKKYCEAVDEDDLHFTEHDYFKDRLIMFMFWLDNGFIKW